jgi:hypothetical protein
MNSIYIWMRSHSPGRRELRLQSQMDHILMEGADVFGGPVGRSFS